ncbi:MAG TPA: TonB-dependent receptor [Chitinophagaceae bacterium]|nr:TonB-dependent receptor [Chitinophagaceae bacterium]
MKKIILMTIFSLMGTVIFSQNQTTVSGRITNDKNEPLHGVSVRVKSGNEGTTTDAQGKFRLTVSSLPVVLIITSVEYEEKEVPVTNVNEVNVIMTEVSKTLEGVIVDGTGDSRLRGRLLSRPYSIEVVRDFGNSPTDPYSSILPKKGLDVTISSMTYKTFSTRGFNGSGSSRVNQFMDGMDNQAPALNFAVGNFIGLTDLDIESIEILPGASSALFGPGGVNGTIILNSKSPFKYPGLSIQIKNGITNVGKEQRDKIGGFYDYSLRYAKNFNDKFAFKVGFQYIRGIDWLADDTTNYKRVGSNGFVIPGTRQSDPNYDGVNVYGDETSVDIRPFIYGAFGGNVPAPFQPYMVSPFLISRTGYNEEHLIDPETKNLKLNGALHYKLTKDIEAILAGHWGKGNTVYSGNGRYAFKDIKIGQYKIELKHKNWFLRAYTTQEDAGEAYSAGITAQFLNEAWKRSYDSTNVTGSWYPQYTGAFLTAKSQGATDAMAHAAARGFADQGRPAAGSSQFNQLFDAVRKTPIPNGGLFKETSQMWMGEGQYNFSDKIKFAEVIVGANLKKYILDSDSTLFYEPNGPIKINEWGMYAQAAKKFFQDKLTLTLAGRYDKNENFDGKFTPRVTALINVAKNNNIRLSYQTAYKFPTTQHQWIRLNLGNVILLGGLPWVNDYMNVKAYPTLVYTPPTTSPFVYKKLKPESMRSFEIGYKGSFHKKLLLDMYAYFGKYTDFTGRILLIQPTNNNKLYSILTNSETEIKGWGAGIGLDYDMANNFFTSFNAYTDNLTNVPTGFMAGFNTPKYRINAGIGNRGFGKEDRFGFSVNLRWQDEFFWEGGGLADGTVPGYTTLDAQVNYKLPKIKSMIKLGGTNITNNYYRTGFANPYIGGMYYISFGYNIF